MRFSILVLAAGLACFQNSANASPSSAPNFEIAWGQCCNEDGNFNDPQDIAISGDGTLYIVDHGRMQRFSANGSFLSQWPFPAGMAIDIDSAGNIYAATWTDIRKLSPSGTELTRWGAEGSEEGQFSGIQGLAIGPNGTLYVADSGNHRVQQFSMDGAFVRSWGADAQGNGNLFQPLGIAVDATGNVYVGDHFFASIQKFSETGEFLASLPLPDNTFHYPHDVAIGPQNEIYVVEEDINNVTVMDETGNLLFYIGDAGTGNGQFKLPMAMAISPSGQYFVVDYGNNRVQRFGYPVGISKVSWGLLKTRFTN